MYSKRDVEIIKEVLLYHHSFLILLIRNIHGMRTGNYSRELEQTPLILHPFFSIGPSTMNVNKHEGGKLGTGGDGRGREGRMGLFGDR